MKRRAGIGCAAVAVLSALRFLPSAPAYAGEKHTIFTGRVFRSDSGLPIADAAVLLLDECKTESKDRSVLVRTDGEGRFRFEALEEGRYTISIRAWYGRQEDAPCQLLMGTLEDKESAVVVMKDGDRFVEQVFVKGFKVKGGKTISRDFDLVCRGSFAE